MTTPPERIGTGGANFGSHEPLFEYADKEIRTRLIRGAVGLYCDLDDRAVGVEIKIPQSCLIDGSVGVP